MRGGLFQPPRLADLQHVELLWRKPALPPLPGQHNGWLVELVEYTP